MRITAITRYKHGTIWELLNRLGWSQSELARRAELHPSELGRIINLARRPTQRQAEQIQRAFGEAGEYLDVLEEWPESFQGTGKAIRTEQTADVQPECLPIGRETLQIPQTATATWTEEQSRKTEMLLSTLTEREAYVLKARYCEGLTLDEIGSRIQLTGNRVMQIQSKAIRKMRHPERVRVANDILETT